MGGSCRKHRRDEKCTKILGGKVEGKKPVGRRRCRGVGNIKMDFRGNMLGMCGKIKLKIKLSL
jgi:hypothetical protein